MNPASFNGHDIQDATYRSWFEVSEPTFERSVQPVAHRVPRQSPVFVGSDPSERNVILHIAIKSGGIDAGQLQLEEWFAAGLEGELVVDDDGTQKALDCVVLRSRRYSPTTVEFTAQLTAHVAAWRSADATTTTEAVTSSGQSWTDTNAGNADDDGAVLRFTPDAQKSAANGQLYRQRVAIVPQNDRDFIGYAFDLTDGGLDHAALVSAGKAQADGDDVRLLKNGVEDLPYWWGEHVDNDPNSAAAKVWTNLTVPAARTTELLEAMTATEPADGDEIPAPLRGVRQFPRSGAFRVGTEIITYGSWTPANADGQAAFQDITRGAWGSTAAIHAAAAAVEWVPFFVDVLYGWSGAEAPEDRPDLEPMLDLTSNTLTNVRLEWLDFVDDTEGYARSMQWRRRQRARDTQYDRIVGARGEPLGALTFEYQTDGPEADKPGVNEYWFPFPSGTDDDGSGNVASITRTLSATMAMIARAVDGEGQEADLETYSGALTSSADSIVQPALPAYELSFQGRSQVVWSEGSDSATLTERNGATEAETWIELWQAIQFESDGIWSKSRVFLEDDSVSNGTYHIQADNAGEPTDVNIVTGSVAAGTGAQEYIEIDHANIRVFSGQTYWFGVRTPTTQQDYGLFFRPGPLPSQSCLYREASAASTFVEQPGRMVVAAFSTDIDSFPEQAEATDGDQALVTAATVWLLAAGVPDFQWLPEEEIYHASGEHLENQTTQQRVTLRNVVCKTGETIAVDTAKRTAINETTGENVIAGVEFSDPQHPFTRVSGTNTLAYTGAGVTGMTVAVRGYDRWS